MKLKLKSNYWLIAALLAFGFCFLLFFTAEQPNLQRQFERFQNKLVEKETQHVKRHLEFKQHSLQRSSEEWWASLTKFSNDPTISYSIAQEDELVFWTKNELSFTDLGSDVNDGYHLLGNGLFHVLKTTVDGTQIISCWKVKSMYAYENEYLQNGFTSGLYFPGKVVPSHLVDTQTDYAVHNAAGELVFYIAPTDARVKSSPLLQLMIYLLFLLGIVFMYTAIEHKVAEKSWRFGKAYYFMALFALFVPLLLLADLNPFQAFALFDPELYASSELLPNLGTLILLLVFFGLVLRALYRFEIPSQEKQRVQKWQGFLLYVFLMVLAYTGSYVFSSLVINSTISLEIDRLFSLEPFSFVAIAVMALILLFYILAGFWVAARLKGFQRNQVALIWFFTAVAYFLFEVFYGQAFLISALWPAVINGLILYVYFQQGHRPKFVSIVLILATAAAYSAFSLYEYNQLNELQKRALFAHQLITDRDAATEVEFLALEEQLVQPDVFEQFITLAEEGELQKNIHDFIDNCCGDPFWERYDMSFYLFENQSALSPRLSGQGVGWQDMRRIISDHAVVSEFSEQLYHVVDNFDRISYIGEVTYNHYTLFIKMQSKRIPEQIGFPRILINQSALVIEELEAYSIARYFNGELVMRYGLFNYPVVEEKLTEQWGNKEGHFVMDGMSHFVFKDKDQQSIIISSPLKSWLENVTNFSYLFIFYGFVFFLFQLIFKNGVFELSGVSMSLKIQLVMISILVISFIVFGAVAGAYVKNQYNSFTLDNIQEKLYSVEIEVKQKLGDSERIERITMGTYLDFILKKFSTVFATDINLYDLEGGLLATSQPRLYSKGVAGDQMNPHAYQSLKMNKSSEFIHQESIGDLAYLSAYLPLMNFSGELLGYLNLQHFSKQNVYESQLSGFLVTIINLAVLFLVVSVIATLFVSTWVTSPLRMIQQSIGRIELGKPNKPINYKGSDELGALVKEYNNKLEELELKAMQLAKSERESAWREMAKQVAHEIKNPLTPMKLSLQHFQRSFDPADPNAKEKINRISASLVEQINTLTNIANEFSSFAKMPKPNEETLVLIEMLGNVVQIFESEADGIQFSYEHDQIFIHADKDLMIRAFNNIIKNALQAIPEGTTPDIHIDVKVEDQHVIVAIQDNGVGIPEEMRQKIFIPNFTTKSTGAGLGLAMVRQIIENHNGEIWFEPNASGGTTFLVRLPLKN
jgi:signal transduction histidine kinase